MKMKLAAVMVIVLSFAGMVFFSKPAEAAYCTNGAAGRAGCRGFFTNNLGSSACCSNVTNVFPAGLYVNSANQMINTLQSRLNGSNHQNRIGAAFVIDVMMGLGPYNSYNAGVTAARNNFDAWADLVRAYDNNPPNGYGVRWNVSRNPATNSAYFRDIADDAFHTDSGGSVPIIEFFAPGGRTFRIERSCGNLLGGARLPAIPTNTPPEGNFTVDCDPTDGSNTVTITQMIDRDASPNTDTTGQIVIGNGDGRLTRRVNSEGTVLVFRAGDGLKLFTTQNIRFFVRDKGNGNRLVNVRVKDTRNCLAGGACAGSNVVPSAVDPTAQFSITVNVRTNSAIRPPGSNTISLDISPSGGGATWSTSASKGVNPDWETDAPQTFTTTFSNLGPSGESGTYTYTWAYTSSSNPSLNVGGCTGEITIGLHPYMAVYGGDVLAGAYEADGGGSCYANEDAGALGWNSEAPGYRGAGTEFGAMVNGPLRYFATAINANTVSNNPHKPDGLSFANVGTSIDSTGASRNVLNIANGLYGGFYSNNSVLDSENCDFTSDAPDPVSAATAESQINSLLSGGGIPRGVHVIYAQGTVHINRDITYANSGSWSRISDIPYFKLVVVGGDIIIHNNVSQLDGVYVAEPSIDSTTGIATGGVIYTCGNGSGPADINSPSIYALCNRKLTVNGSFAAKQVRFLRTSGTIGNAIDNASNEANSAEVFHYSPEVWLPRSTGADIKWQAVTGLPPVL